MSSRTKDDLKEMQSWDLDKKIQVTQTRIIEWYEYFQGKVYVSFSGGKDSTVLLDIVRHVYPDVLAVYIDTGLEYPEAKSFVKSVDNVQIIRPEMNYKQVIEKYGYPLISKEVAQKIYEARRCPTGVCAGRFEDDNPHALKYGKRYSMAKWKWLRDSDIPISDYCCKIMKKRPASKFEKESGLKPIVGSMACESNMRQTSWIRHGCNAFDGKRQMSNPISFWMEQDIYEYIVRYGITIPAVYGKIVQDENGKYYTTGCDRTGCVWCCFGCHLEKEPTRFQRLKQTHPKLYDYCMKPTTEHGLGYKEIFDYMNKHGMNIKYE